MNEAQKLVGTWVLELGSKTNSSRRTYVFNADGTGTSSGNNNAELNGNIFWGISTSGELHVKFGKDSSDTGPLFLSPDERRMIHCSVVYKKG